MPLNISNNSIEEFNSNYAKIYNKKGSWASYRYIDNFSIYTRGDCDSVITEIIIIRVIYRILNFPINYEITRNQWHERW